MNMKLKEKLDVLQTKHMGEWLKTRSIVFNELSSQQTTMCCCGRLATGLHENNCRKFNNNVIKETVYRLKHLIKNIKT